MWRPAELADGHTLLWGQFLNGYNHDFFLLGAIRPWLCATAHSNRPSQRIDVFVAELIPCRASPFEATPTRSGGRARIPPAPCIVVHKPIFIPEQCQGGIVEKVPLRRARAGSWPRVTPNFLRHQRQRVVTMGRSSWVNILRCKGEANGCVGQ